MASVRASRSLPSGVTRRVSSGGRLCRALSETARTTSAGYPEAAARATRTADSMSAATAPLAAKSAALASGVATISRVVTSEPVQTAAPAPATATRW